MNLAMFTMFIMIYYVFALSVPLLDWFKWLIVRISMHFYDQVLIWDDLCCLFSIKVFECFCCIRVSWRCSVIHGAVRIHFRVVPFFLMGFSTVLSWVLLWSLPICFWCRQLPFVALRFQSTGKAVCFECVFVCVSFLARYDPPLYSGTCVAVFDLFTLCCLFILNVAL